MFPFFESISLRKARIENLEEHQHRVDRTFYKFYPNKKVLQLKEFLSKMELPEQGHYKLKISYHYDHQLCQFQRYEAQKFENFILIHSNELNYNFKFTDRQLIEHYKRNLKPNEEIIMLKNNFITDASFANLIFYDGKKWWTPTSYLLPGTMRSALLKQNKIQEAEINIHDLARFEKFALINALNPLEQTHIYPIQLIINP